MIERRPLLDLLAHLVLILGVAAVALPLWIAFVASTHGPNDFMSGLVPLWPGDRMVQNYRHLFSTGVSSSGVPPVGRMLWNSFVMAMAIAVGKIAISVLSAFAVVYFRFPGRIIAFWLIFATLMLPVEVRIVPTFKVVADLGLLNSYAGLSIPLIASATATFLFRQVFLSMPDELTEAARIDGAGPMRFFRDILLPLTRTNVAALFVIMFIYGWNQYLWPLLITTDARFYTIVAGIKRMADVADAQPQWHLVMATAMLAAVPPLLVVIFMQRLFIRGLVETEK